jgi:hypothetical protein
VTFASIQSGTTGRHDNVQPKEIHDSLVAVFHFVPSSALPVVRPWLHLRTWVDARFNYEPRCLGPIRPEVLFQPGVLGEPVYRARKK